MKLEEVYTIIVQRKGTMPANSYTADLLNSGLDRIIQKVGEESMEFVIAAKNSVRARIIEEAADLFYHVLVLLVYLHIDIQEVYKELGKRNKK